MKKILQYTAVALLGMAATVLPVFAGGVDVRGPASATSQPTFSNAICLVPGSGACGAPPANGQVGMYYDGTNLALWAASAARMAISNSNADINVSGNNENHSVTAFSVNTDLFKVNSTQVLARSNSLTQFSVGTAGSAWLDVQSTGIALGLSTTTGSSTNVTLGTNSNILFGSNSYIDMANGVGLKVSGKVAVSPNTPTISSGFGTSPSVTNSNGSAAFTINVGTGGTANSGVIGLPTASNGWVCYCQDITTPGANMTRMTASTTTSCTVSNVAMSTGSAAAWTASDILHCIAMGR